MFKKTFSLIFSIIFLGFTVFALINFRTVLDYAALYTTQPSSTAATYSAELELTETGKLIFYGTYPKIDSKAEFNVDCNPGSNVLEFGCYFSGTNRIFLLDIQEPNLRTMIDVGAGHELMHAVYARLSSSEKDKINGLLEADYAKFKNPNLDERLKSYAVTEPGNRENELHSILATEDPNLSPELEAHYKEYFKNRKKIVAWHAADEKYITGKEAALKNDLKKIQTENAYLKLLDARMIALKNAKKIKEYNALVPEQNALVFSLRIEVEKYNQDVLTYNDIIASINSHTLSSFDISKIR